MQSSMARVGEFPHEVVPFKNQFNFVEAGQNILVKIGDTYSLMKYERSDTEVEDHDRHRANRHTYISCIGNLLFALRDGTENEYRERVRREYKRFKGNIFASHRMDFTFDMELQEYLPASYDQDLFMKLAQANIKGEITHRQDPIEVVTDPKGVLEILQRIMRPGYLDAVIVPFLDGRSTEFRVPTWKPHRWGFQKTDMDKLLARFGREVREIPHGGFVYVGCKEEVYLLGLARGDSDTLHMQGTYTTSTKPPLYFSNNHLHHFDSRSAKYSDSRAPSFNDVPFVFPQVGRSQNCKNTIFTGEPDVITGDLDEALAHFATTDFAEFGDMVRRYRELLSTPHPTLVVREGCQYFY